MANKESVFMKQGLLDLGADFEADMERAATFIEKNLAAINEAITLIKQGARLSGKKRATAERLGLSASSSEQSAQNLDDLTLMKEMFASIGAYPHLVAEAQMWDGKSELDPVGFALNYARKEREKMEGEKDLSREEWEEKKISEADLAGMGMLSLSLKKASDAFHQVDKQEPVYLDVPEARNPDTKTVKARMKQALDEMREAGGFTLSEKRHVSITKLGFKEVLNHIGDRKSAEIFCELPKIAKCAHYMYSSKNTDTAKKSKQDIKRFHYYLSSVADPEGKKYYVLLVIAEKGNGSLFYDLNNESSLDILKTESTVTDLPRARIATAGLTNSNGAYESRLQQTYAAVKHYRENLEKNQFSLSVRNLASMHTLSVNNFKKAAKLGGMPLPSVAVSRLDQPYAWGGADAITLVTGSELADPALNNDVYSADAYTGMIPFLHMKESDKALSMLQEVGRLADVASERYKLDESSVISDSIKDDLTTFTDPADTRYVLSQGNLNVMQLFAASQDYKFRTPMRNVSFFAWEDGLLRSEVARFAKNCSPKASAEARQQAQDQMKDAIIKAAKRAEMAGVKKFIVTMLKNKAAQIGSSVERAEGLRNDYQDAKKTKGRAVDTQAIQQKIKAFWNKNAKKREAFLDFLMVYFSGEMVITETGETATLDNITRYMKSTKARGSEKGLLGMSNGEVFAARAFKIQSLAELKDRRDSIVSSETHEKLKAKAESKMEAFGLAIAESSKGDYFTARGAANEILSKAFNGAHVKAELSRSGLSFKTGTKRGELAKLGAEAVAAIDALPMDYFESVPNRAVTLDEWAYAVAPDTFKKDKELAGILKANKIKPLWYDGSPEGRNAALASLQDSDIAFALRSLETAARAPFAARADEAESVEILKRLDQLEAALRLGSIAGDESLGSGAAQLASIISLLEAVKGVLPPEYSRMGKLNVSLKWASVYAEMVEKGEIPRGGRGVLSGVIAQKFLESMTKKKEGLLLQGVSEEEAKPVMAELASERLEQSMIKIAAAARVQVDKFIKARAWERVETTRTKAYPTKQAGKKSPRGKLSAKAYLEMEEACEMMAMTQHQVFDKSTAIRGELAALTPEMEGYESKVEELNAKLDKLKVFGDWAGMSAPQARAAAEAFVGMVQSGKTLWQFKQDQQKRRDLFIKAAIRSNFTKENTSNSRSEAKRSLNPFTNIKRMSKEGAYSLMNYNQLMLAAKQVFGESFVRERIQEMTDANQSLALAEADMKKAFIASVVKHAELDASSEVGIIDWLNDFAKPKKTGIMKREVKTYTIKLSMEEAREWVALSASERKKKREAITEESNAERMAALNVPNEYDVKELSKQLKEYDEALEAMAKAKETGEKYEGTRVSPSRKSISVSGFYAGAEVELVASKEVIMNNILIMEQEDYHHLIFSEGFTPRDASGKVIDWQKDRETPIDVAQSLKPLYDYIGEAGKKIAYDLRDYVNVNSKPVFEKYAKERGVNLTQKHNYWRGHFDLELVQDKDSLMKLNAATGNSYGFLIDRVKHYSKLDWTATLSGQFFRSVSDQNNYLYTSHITSQWRRLLMDREFSLALNNEVGAEYMNSLKQWLNLIDGSSLDESKGWGAVKRHARAMMGGVAKAALSGNGWVLAKQSSAILHGMLGGEVPRGVIDKADGTRELTYRHIGLQEFGAALARTKSGRGKISLKELSESRAFQSRLPAENERAAQRLHMSDGQKQYARMGWFSDTSMGAIDWTDRNVNLQSMHALADAIYIHAEQVSEKNELGLSHEELKQISLDGVGRALSLAAQPKRITEKTLAAATGGIITNVAMMFRSEVLSKLGLTMARILRSCIPTAGLTNNEGALKRSISQLLTMSTEIISCQLLLWQYAGLSHGADGVARAIFIDIKMQYGDTHRGF